MLQINKHKTIKNFAILFIVIQFIQIIFCTSNSCAYVNVQETQREIRQLDERIRRLNHRLNHDVKKHRAQGKEALAQKLSNVVNRIRELEVQQKQTGANNTREIERLKQQKRQIVRSSREEGNFDTDRLANSIKQDIYESTRKKAALERSLRAEQQRYRQNDQQNRKYYGRKEELKRMRQEEIRMQQDDIREKRSSAKREAEMRQRRAREAEVRRMRQEEIRMQQDDIREKRSRAKREAEMRQRRAREAEVRRMRQEEIRMQQDNLREKQSRAKRAAEMRHNRAREESANKVARLRKQGRDELSKLRSEALASKTKIMYPIGEYNKSFEVTFNNAVAKRDAYKQQYQNNPSSIYWTNKLNEANNTVKHLKTSFLQKSKELKEIIRSAFYDINNHEKTRASQIIDKYSRLGIYDLKSYYDNLQNFNAF